MKRPLTKKQTLKIYINAKLWKLAHDKTMTSFIRLIISSLVTAGILAVVYGGLNYLINLL